MKKQTPVHPGNGHYPNSSGKIRVFSANFANLDFSPKVLNLFLHMSVLIIIKKTILLDLDVYSLRYWIFLSLLPGTIFNIIYYNIICDTKIIQYFVNTATVLDWHCDISVLVFLAAGQGTGVPLYAADVDAFWTVTWIFATSLYLFHHQLSKHGSALRVVSCPRLVDFCLWIHCRAHRLSCATEHLASLRHTAWLHWRVNARAWARTAQ